MTSTYVPTDYSKYVTAKEPTLEPSSSTYVPTDYSKYGTETEIDSGQEEQFTEESLSENPEWLDYAKTIYKSEEGEGWKGSNSRLAWWLKNRHSELGNDISSMGWLASKADSLDGDTKRAWVNSMDMYENLDSDMSTFLRATKNTIQDPFLWGPALLTLGWSGVARLAGGKATTIAGRFAFKEQLKKALAKEGVTKKGLKEWTKKGVSKEVTEDVLDRARRSAGTRSSLAVGGAGALYEGAASGLDNIVQQQFEDEYTTPSDHIDWGEVAGEAGFGALVGAAFGALPTKGWSRFNNKRMLRKNEAKLKELEAAQKEGTGILGDTVDHVNVPITPRTQSINIYENLVDASSRLDIEGTADINMDSVAKLRKDINLEYKPVKVTQKKKGEKAKKVTLYKDKNNPSKKITLEQKNKAVDKEARSLYRETKKTIIDEGKNQGIVFREVGKSGGGVFKGTKKWEPTQAAGLGEDKRSVITKVLARISRLAGTSTPREVRQLQRLREGAGRGMEQKIRTRVGRLEKAVKKELGVRFDKLDKKTLRDLNEILAGNTKLRLSYAARKTIPKTLEELSNMRKDISDLQENLLKSGAIEKGSKVEQKITASMPGGGADLHIVRQYEIFDNPNWAKDIIGDEDVIKGAANYFKNRYRKDKIFKDIDDKVVEDGIDSLGDAEKTIYNNVMGESGYVNMHIKDILDSHSEEDLWRVFDTDLKFQAKKSAKILTKRENIPTAIRDLLGEYKNPISNYVNSAMKINQTIETFKFEKAIADMVANLEKDKVVRVAKEGMDIVSDPRVRGLTGTGESLIPNLDTTPDIGTGRTVRLGSVLPKRSGIRRPITGVLAEERQVLGSEGVRSPLEGLYANKDVADAIINGNEIAVKQWKPLQMYLALQGHTRAAKTIYSITAVARNFLGAGWMALGAGYLSPASLVGLPKVFRGMLTQGTPELRAEMEKGMALGYIQSGIEIQGLREAMRLAGKSNFWDLTSPVYKGTKGLKNAAMKGNTSMVKMYQAMDDMWKHVGFLNEKKNYRQILIDRGDNPDEVVQKLISGDGIPIEITRLDKEAADRVADHMQNYAQVPQFVRYARIFPAADFFAFTTELIRTQSNILRNSLKEISEGQALLNATQGAKGGAQRKVGLKRLGSMVAAHSAAPALSMTSSSIWNMDEPEEGEQYTKREGLEYFNASWDKGNDFLYISDPKKGKGKRINISYINPWAKFHDPIEAGINAMNQGEYVDKRVMDAIDESLIRPFVDTFGVSMIAESISNLHSNTDRYGNPLFTDAKSIPQNVTDGILAFWKPFEPGIVKSATDIYKAATQKPSSWYDTPRTLKEHLYAPAIRKGKSGRKFMLGDQLAGLTGIKPQLYDITIDLGYKINDIKRKMGEAGRIFTNMTQEQSPMTSEQLIEGYEQALEKQFSYAADIFDVISHAKSAGLNNEDIYRAITKDGMFPVDKRVLHNMINEGIFVPPPPLKKEVYLWHQATKRRDGSPPPIREAERELMNVYESYIGSQTGVRGESEQLVSPVFNEKLIEKYYKVK